MLKRLIFFILILHVHCLYAQTCNEVSIYFKSNRHTFTASHLADIKQVISSIHPFTFQTVRIEGYCDTIGSERSNTILAQKRIDAVKRALQPLLDSNIYIETINYGESHPASLTDQGKNRYAKIIFVLDTLINLAEKGKGEIWLNTKSLDYLKPCDFNIRILTGTYYSDTTYPAIPLRNTPQVYVIQMPNNCREIYYFPESFYNPETHIGRFPKSIPLLYPYCGNRTDSMNFTINADKVKYDSISKSYYLIQECHLPAGICCGGARQICNSLTFMPEETASHSTALRFYDHEAFQADTIFISDSLVWEDWNCLSIKDSAYVYSIALFDSTYYYLKGDIEQYIKKDTMPFEMNGIKYRYSSASRIYFLKRSDYTSFLSPTIKPLVIKTKRGYIPGIYIKEYNSFIPFKHNRKRKYKGYIIDYPIEFALMYSGTILKENELIVKNKIKKSNTFIKLKPHRVPKDQI